MAIWNGYNGGMEVSVAEAKNRLPKLLRAAEAGEEVIITRRGKPVVRLSPAVPARRKIQFGWARGRIRLKPGWDKPITEEQFLSGEF